MSILILLSGWPEIPAQALASIYILKYLSEDILLIL